MLSTRVFLPLIAAMFPAVMGKMGYLRADLIFSNDIHAKLAAIPGIEVMYCTSDPSANGMMKCYRGRRRLNRNFTLGGKDPLNLELAQKITDFVDALPVAKEVVGCVGIIAIPMLLTIPYTGGWSLFAIPGCYGLIPALDKAMLAIADVTKDWRTKSALQAANDTIDKRTEVNNAHEIKKMELQMGVSSSHLAKAELDAERDLALAEIERSSLTYMDPESSTYKCKYPALIACDEGAHKHLYGVSRADAAKFGEFHKLTETQMIEYCESISGRC